MKVVHIVIAILSTVVAVTQSEGTHFRCDYNYVAEIDGWLKYHDVPANWYDARLRCHLEGTTLASPLFPRLTEAILSVITKNIHTGIHATVSKEDFYSIEGIPLSDIPHVWSSGAPNNLNDDESCLYLTLAGTIGDENCNTPKPYVCYKKREGDELLNECGTIDKAYKMDNATGSCYKFHRVPRIYSRAFMACSAEGGYLSIINSDQEAGVIKRLFAENPASSMVGPFYKDVAYVGFHDWKEHGEWLTIHGETLDKAGYSKWYAREPNNATCEFCGAVYRSAQLLDLKCDTVHAFICEKSPNSLLCD